MAQTDTQRADSGGYVLTMGEILVEILATEIG